MKCFLCFLLLIVSSGFSEKLSLNEVRVHFQKSYNEEESCVKLIAELEFFDQNNNPLFGGYRACAMMLMANYVFNPVTKFTKFTAGKNLLEKCIAADSENIELRFLRCTVQTNAPSFLGYDFCIEQDKLFLHQAILSMTDMELKQMIVSFLNNPEQ